MIVTETRYVNGREFTLTRSDSGRYVVRDGVSYEEALDPAGLGRTYEEGDQIPERDDAEAILSIILGGEE